MFEEYVYGVTKMNIMKPRQDEATSGNNSKILIKILLSTENCLFGQKLTSVNFKNAEPDCSYMNESKQLQTITVL